MRVRLPRDLAEPPASSPRLLVLTFRAVLLLASAGLAKGAHLIWTGEFASLLPRLSGWLLVLPVAGWVGTALAIGALWCWRWWGLWHVLRIPTMAVVLLGLCLPLRRRFRGADAAAR